MPNACKFLLIQVSNISNLNLLLPLYTCVEINSVRKVGVNLFLTNISQNPSCFGRYAILSIFTFHKILTQATSALFHHGGVLQVPQTDAIDCSRIIRR